MKLARFKISIRVDNPKKRQEVIETLRCEALRAFSPNLGEIDGEGSAECWLSLPRGLTPQGVEHLVRKAIEAAGKPPTRPSGRGITASRAALVKTMEDQIGKL